MSTLFETYLNAKRQRRKGAKIFFTTEITENTESLTVFKRPFLLPITLCVLCDLCGKKMKSLRLCAFASLRLNRLREGGVCVV
jgi:hypothetical protein